MNQYTKHAKEPYAVTAKDCAGCVYFGKATSGTERCCEYYYRTGRHRADENTVRNCAEKRLGTKRERLEMTRYEFGARVRAKFY